MRRRGSLLAWTHLLAGPGLGLPEEPLLLQELHLDQLLLLLWRDGVQCGRLHESARAPLQHVRQGLLGVGGDKGACGVQSRATYKATRRKGFLYMMQQFLLIWLKCRNLTFWTSLYEAKWNIRHDPALQKQCRIFTGQGGWCRSNYNIWPASRRPPELLKWHAWNNGQRTLGITWVLNYGRRPGTYILHKMYYVCQVS